jgi:AraC family transcriptional regulator
MSVWGVKNMQVGGNVVTDINPFVKACACTEPAGEILSRRRLPNLELRESAYSRGLILGRHSHAHAYLSFVIDGHYTETYQSNSAICGNGTLRFLPAGEVHSNAYDDGARCLLVQLPPSILDHLHDHSAILDYPGQIAGGKAEWLGRRLYTEFRQRDSAAPIAIEGIVLEILAERMRFGETAARSVPKWLQRAKDMIHAHFLDVPSLTDIARSAGVHPVHLSREFRRYFDCTVGDYMRKLRIDHASHLLVNSGTPLAEIANVCGFADQSHFSSTFKKTVGMTPARFRDMHN